MAKKQLHDIIDLLVDEAYTILQDRIYANKMQYDKLSVSEDKYFIQKNDLLMQEIVTLIEPLMKAVQQTRKIQAETHRDIVKQLRSGKITIDEAKALSPIVDKRAEEDLEF